MMLEPSVLVGLGMAWVLVGAAYWAGRRVLGLPYWPQEPLLVRQVKVQVGRKPR